MCLPVHNVILPHGYICSLSLVFSRSTMICLGMFFFVWSLLNLLYLCCCLSLILGISWLLCLQIFLLFHTLPPCLSFWDSNYTYIRWFDIILRISDDFPPFFSLFVFSLNTFHLAVKYPDAFLLNLSDEIFLMLYFFFLAFHYVCIVIMFLLKFSIFLCMVTFSTRVFKAFSS